MTIRPDKTVVHFVLPELGEAAPELYVQQELWPSVPARELTAIDCLALAVDEIACSNTDSGSFDAGLLKDVATLGHGLDGTYRELRLSRHGVRRAPGVVDLDVVERAEQLRLQTPEPRAVRVVGRVDMIRASTESFSVVLDDGTEVRGTLADDSLGIEDLKRYFHRRVLVHWRAIYRPSGRLLRLDAEALEDGEHAPALFSRVPEPILSHVALRTSGPAANKGVAGFFGTWPGDESEQELLEALSELG